MRVKELSKNSKETNLKKAIENGQTRRDAKLSNSARISTNRLRLLHKRITGSRCDSAVILAVTSDFDVPFVAPLFAPRVLD